MKKTIYILIAVLVLGGGILLLSNSDLLKGSFSPQISGPGLEESVRDTEEEIQTTVGNTTSGVAGVDEDKEAIEGGERKEETEESTAEESTPEASAVEKSNLGENKVSSQVSTETVSSGDADATSSSGGNNRDKTTDTTTTTTTTTSSGRDNNQRADSPDLTLENITYNSVDQMIGVEACIVGEGDLSAPELDLSYEIVRNNKTVASKTDYKISTLQTLSDTCQSYVLTSLNAEDMKSGEFSVTVEIDTNDAIDEKTESNNTLTKEFTYTEPEKEYACSSVNLKPDTYELQYNVSTKTWESTVALEVEFTSKEITLSNFLSFLMAFTIGDTWEGTLVLESTGDGVFYYQDEAFTEYPVFGNHTLTDVSYVGAKAGDTITAFMKGEESACSDKLTLTAESSITGTTSSGPSDLDGSSSSGSSTSTDSSTSSGSSSSTSGSSSSSSSVDSTSGAGGSASSSSSGGGGSSSGTGGGAVSRGSTAKAETCEHPFKDIEGREFEDLICEAYQTGLVSGKTSTIFAPTDKVTRAEWAKWLVLASGDAPVSGRSAFTDIKTSDWYYGYIVQLEKKDVLRVRDGSSILNPNVPQIRGWAALLMVRYVDGSYYGDSNFKDIKMSDPFGYAVNLASETEVKLDGTSTPVINGYGNGLFGPYDYISREHAIVLIMRYMQALEDQKWTAK